MKQKYNINKDFEKLTIISAPMAKPLLPIGNRVIDNLPKGMNNSNVLVDEMFFNSFDGSKVKLYIITPKNTNEILNCLVYFHGGGFIYKAVFAQYQMCCDYASYANIKVVFVDYRLAPKFKYPIPYFDCLACYEYVCKNKGILNINNIFVGGDSAGGNLAIAVTHKKCIDDYDIPTKQMLIYPVVDRDLQTESKNKFTDTPVWNSVKNKKMWQLYIGSEPYQSLITNIPTNVPKTYVEVAEYDCLRDEGIYYGKKVGAQIEMPLGTIHGFDACTSSEIVKESFHKRIMFLKNCNEK